MKTLSILRAVNPIILFIIIFFVRPAYVIAGAALSDFSRNDNTVSLSVVAWSEAAGMANPCYGHSSCYVGPDVRYSKYGIGGLYGSCEEANACVRAEDLPTLADIAERYKREHPLPFSTTFTVDHLEDTSSCVGMVYIDRPSFGGHAILLPGSTCVVIPPNGSRCEINIPPYIQHGTLSTARINGNTASATGSITCNFSGTAAVSISADEASNVIYLNGSKMVSEVQINGTNPDGSVILNVSANNPTPLNITSTLKSNGVVVAGKYTGTALFYVNYI